MRFSEGLSEKNKASGRNEGIKFGDPKEIYESIMRGFRQNNITRRNELARESAGWNIYKENSLIQASLKLAGYDIGSSVSMAKLGLKFWEIFPEYNYTKHTKLNRTLGLFKSQEGIT